MGSMFSEQLKRDSSSASLSDSIGDRVEMFCQESKNSAGLRSNFFEGHREWVRPKRGAGFLTNTVRAGREHVPTCKCSAPRANARVVESAYLQILAFRCDKAIFPPGSVLEVTDVSH